MKTAAAMGLIACAIMVGIIAVTAIEAAQLDRHCKEWGWTYCIPKTLGSIHYKTSEIPYQKGWWI